MIFRFDTEIQRAKDELNHERTLKDKINREKEKALTEKYQLEHDLAVSFNNLAPPVQWVYGGFLATEEKRGFLFRDWIGGGLASWLGRWTGNPKFPGSNPPPCHLMDLCLGVRIHLFHAKCN